VFCGMLILTVVVIAIDALVGVVEKRLLGWRPPSLGSDRG